MPKINNLVTDSTAMKTGFRNTQWDPIILVSQIVAMQSLLYVSLGAIMYLMDLLAGANHTLDHLFQYHVSASHIIVKNICKFGNVIKFYVYVFCRRFMLQT